MSRTTDMIICVGILDEDRLEEFSMALEAAGFSESGYTPHFASLKESLEELPGSKFYTDGVWAACWNHGRPENVLIPTFKAFPWVLPKNALLIIAEEQSDTEVIRP